MKKISAALFACGLLLSACNSIKSEPLPSDAKDPTLAKIGQKLDDEEKKLLVGYLMRREMAKAFGGQPLPDGVKTVGEALDAQRKWVSSMTEGQQKAEALRVEVEQKRKIVADEISKSITVAFLNARFQPSSAQEGRFDDYEFLSFAVQNGGRKPIKAMKGRAVFIDTFGDEYVTVPMQFEEDIAPNEKKEIELSMEINKFMDEHKKVMSLDNTKRFRFDPEQIVYEDGSTLKAPEPAS